MSQKYHNFVQNVQHGLTNEQIAEQCPAIFATSAHESRSDRYGYVPTSEVIAGLRDVGFVVTTAMQSGSRQEGKAEYTKHLLRFRKSEYLGVDMPDIHEIVLVNAHDGTASYQLMSGLFRMVCTNGLIAGDFDHEVRIKHTAHAVDRVVESTLTIVEEGKEIMETVEQMKQVELNREEQLLLAEFAMAARFDLEMKQGHITQEEMALVPYQPADFLRVHRVADRSNDLYTSMNVVQENVIKGGVSRMDWEGHRRTTKAIKGIDQNIKLNQMLWQLSERMLQMKQS